MEVSGANTGYGGFRGKHRLGRFLGQTQVSEVIRGKHRLGSVQWQTQVREVSGANTG